MSLTEYPIPTLVLDASPLENIRNTREIHRVIHHGEVVDREALLADPAPPRAAVTETTPPASAGAPR